MIWYSSTSKLLLDGLTRQKQIKAGEALILQIVALIANSHFCFSSLPLSIHSLYVIYFPFTHPLSLCHHAPLCLSSYRHSSASDVASYTCGEEGGGAQRVPTPLQVKSQLQQGNRGGHHCYNQLEIPPRHGAGNR